MPFNDNRPDRTFNKGRGTSLPIANRFEQIHFESDFEQLDLQDQTDAVERKVNTEYFVDDSASIVSFNDSPDIDFNYSLNPYRGCSHGCSYCYARPSHEFLGFNPAIDFESKIMVKLNAARLFRKWLRRDSWNPEPVMLSGVTDCYQGCEKDFRITRQCLEAAFDFQQPIRLITKNALIRRDIDVLTELAKRNLVAVTISVTTLDQSLTRTMEPRTSSPQARLDTIAELADAGVPVVVLTAPIIPGLNDSEIPAMLKAVADAGASYAGYVMLRLPMAVAPIFKDWLETMLPDQAEKIVNRISSVRQGKLNSSEFGERFVGKGIWAEQIGNLFRTSQRRYGLQKGLPVLDCSRFRRPDQHLRVQQQMF